MNMKDVIKKHRKGIVLFLVVGIILIPLLIHILFKLNAPTDFFVATWTSGDVLAFYGVIIGAIATVGGVYLTIQYAQKSSLDDTYNRVRPFVVVVPKMVEGKVNLIPDLLGIREKEAEQRDEYYNEYVLDRICFVYHKGTITAHSKLTPEQEESKRKFGNTQVFSEDGSVALTHTDLTTLTIVVENLGVGVANKLCVGFVKEDDGVISDKLHLFGPLKVDASFNIELYIEDPLKEDYGNYELIFEYYDIYENVYRQKFQVELREGKIGSDLFLWNEGQQEIVC